MSIYISAGNIKTGNIPTVSLPADITYKGFDTCPDSTRACRATCYAKKAQRQYPNVMPCRKRNMDIARSASFVPDTVSAISRRKLPILRIHEAADFFSREYFLSWRRIAEQCSDTQFYAFTKVYKLFRFKLPDNFRLIASVYYDEKRKPPKGAPVFETVRRGDVGRGTRCHGHCDSCGICPWIADGARVWAEVH